VSVYAFDHQVGAPSLVQATTDIVGHKRMTRVIPSSLV
jgi:hypothetical protein